MAGASDSKHLRPDVEAAVDQHELRDPARVGHREAQHDAGAERVADQDRA